MPAHTADYTVILVIKQACRHTQRISGRDLAHSGLQAVILVISPIQLHEKQRNKQSCATLEDTI